MTAEVTPAVRTLETGLVPEVVDEAEGESAPGAQVAAKDLASLRAGRPIDGSLAAETSARTAAQRTAAEGREGLDAFLTRRPPAWQPRNAG